MNTAMITRIRPLAMDSEPIEKCTSPTARSSIDTMAAVVSILRATRRFVASSMSAVLSRNGTSAILGPTPMSSSRNRSAATVR